MRGLASSFVTLINWLCCDRLLDMHEHHNHYDRLILDGIRKPHMDA